MQSTICRYTFQNVDDIHGYFFLPGSYPTDQSVRRRSATWRSIAMLPLQTSRLWSMRSCKRRYEWRSSSSPWQNPAQIPLAGAESSKITFIIPKCLWAVSALFPMKVVDQHRARFHHVHRTLMSLLLTVRETGGSGRDVNCLNRDISTCSNTLRKWTDDETGKKKLKSWWVTSVKALMLSFSLLCFH